MSHKVTIIGAGLVGSLLGILLRKRGYEVIIYDRRPDIRNIPAPKGRTINLTISTRGWKALELAGVKDDIESIAIPMYGRSLHQINNTIDFQPYSKNNEAIYSISRGELNKKLLSIAENCGIIIEFEHQCIKVNVPENIVHFQLKGNSEKIVEAELLFGADGTFSALRKSYLDLEGVSGDTKYLEYGYKELCILSGKNGEWLMEKNALHLWPRNHSMLIAMPNTDGTFTCTIFLPFQGNSSFAGLTTENKVMQFFDEIFPDAQKLMPELLKDFFTNPVSTLHTTFISNWRYKGLSALIGDAAHTIVPFYGQGMNAGFEDCTILSELIDKEGDNWENILSEYEKLRKPNGDAIAQLALFNFAEIRDKVTDSAFLHRKKIEQELSSRFPNKFIPIYEMVSFSHTPYNTAMQCIQAQDKLLDKIMSSGDFFSVSKNNKFEVQLKEWVTEYSNFVQKLN